MSCDTRRSTLKEDRQSKILSDLKQLDTTLYATETESSQYPSRSILVSIDTEYDFQSNQIDQIGIASLESTVLSDDTSVAVNSLLFLLKKYYIPRNTYHRQYLYGAAQSIIGVDLSDFLTAVLTPIDKHQVILVGHSIESDVLAIKRYCGLDIKALPCVTATIDTAYIPSIIFPQRACYEQTSLKRACRLVGIHAKQLHNAGNDAYYTLKLLLLLFHSYKQRDLSRYTNLAEEARTSWQKKLERILQIGHNNIHMRRPPKKIRDTSAQDNIWSIDDDEEIVGLAVLDVSNDGQV